MKRTYLLLSACILVLGCSQCAKPQSIRISGSPFSHTLPPVASPAYFIIVSGQSNALGRSGNYDTYYTTAKTGTKRYDSTTQTFAGYSSGYATNGFELQTGGAQFTTKGDTVRVIKVAQTSLPISDWGPNGFMFAYLRRDIDTAFAIVRRQGKNPVVLSTLWVQGEQNVVINSAQASYQDSLTHFIDNYAAIDPAIAGSQFVMVKLRSDQAFSPNSYTIVNTSIDNLVTARSYCKAIDPVAISMVYADLAHYTFPSYILLANAWNALIL